jgi:hypothetical protein
MENVSKYQQLTPEGVLASILELRESQAETERLIRASSAKFDKEMAESSARFDKEMAESSARFDKEMAESSARFDKEMAERRAETDRLRKESEAKFEREMAASRADWEKRSAELNKQMGGMSNSHGSFAEEYFYNSFEHGKQNFFGEKFDEIEKSAKGLKKGYKDEYDILLINGKSIGIVEVKYKAHVNDLLDVLKKAETFRINFPDYAGHRIYLGLASLAFYPELEQECIDKGIAIMKQVGDTVVIYDEHLKVF